MKKGKDFIPFISYCKGDVKTHIQLRIFEKKISKINEDKSIRLFVADYD